MNHPQPPFIPIDLTIDETMDGTMQAVGRAVELKRVSTQEADGALILNTHESTRAVPFGRTCMPLQGVAQRLPSTG